MLERIGPSAEQRAEQEKRASLPYIGFETLYDLYQ